MLKKPQKIKFSIKAKMLKIEAEVTLLLQLEIITGQLRKLLNYQGPSTREGEFYEYYKRRQILYVGKISMSHYF